MASTLAVAVEDGAARRRDLDRHFLARPRHPDVLPVMHDLQRNQFDKRWPRPRAGRSPASHVRRRSTMSAISVTGHAPPIARPYFTIATAPSAWLPGGPPGRMTGVTRFWPLASFSSRSGLSSSASCSSSVRPFVEQLPLLGPQGFQLVAGKRVGDAGSQHAGRAGKHHAGRADGRPAGAARLRIGLAHQARVVDLLAIEEHVFLRQGAQRIRIAARTRGRSAPAWRWKAAR